VTGNQGTVLIEDFTANLLGSYLPPGHGILIADSRAVTLNNCAVVGGDTFLGYIFGAPSPITIRNSSVSMSSVVARAYPVDRQGAASAPSVTVEASDVIVQSCNFTGADAYYWVLSGPIRGWVGPSAAISALDSRLRMTGSRVRPTRVRPGSPGGSGVAAAAIRHLGAYATIVDPDPARVIIAGGTAGPLLRRHTPSLLAGGAAPGRNLIAVLESVGGAPAFLFVATPRAPIPSPFGGVWLDPATIYPLRAMQLSPSGGGIVSLPVPNLVSLEGTMIALQALVQSGSDILLSPPAITAIH
jgi:hypothetical protein